MIELCLAPPPGAVARLALAPVAAPVLIITSMAGNTCRIQLLLYTCLVTGRAFNIAMPACKRVIRPGMIEHDTGPVFFAVAFITFNTVTTGMYVIKPVATIAVCRRILIALTEMTAVAIQVCMLSSQAKIRSVMIKFLITPTALVVTIQAIITKLFFVNVIFLVTINTCSRCVAVFIPTDMAGTATGPGVRPLQQKIRTFVIKRFNSQLDDIRITPLVIGVAVFACSLPCHAPTMKSLPAAYVCTDLFMAIRTQAVLAFLAEWLMALAALFLVFGMSLHQLAGHNQRFNTGRYSATFH